MIRINLLGVEGERAKRKRGVGFDLGQKVTVACSLILLGAVLGIGWQFRSLRQDSNRLDQELTAARQEVERLASVLEQVQEFDTRRAQLQQRVALIEQLRRGQSGPVHMLDQISRSVPERLWLTELRQEGGTVTIQGRATALTALSDFVSNLEISGHFSLPVEIVDSQVEEQPEGDVVRFEVRAQFVLPAL